VEGAVARLREALKADDAAKIRTATEALQRASHAMAEQMYKHSQTPPAGQGSGSGGSEATEGQVVDAEVVDA
jgi:molecular chaperone DnaK